MTQAPATGYPALPLNVADMQRRKPRLLVVDDQAVNIQTLYRVFADECQVLMARNAEAALAVCDEQQPDLILLDVMMPGMDGYALCERLKADDRTRDIPVIFVTSHSDEAAESRGLDVGAVDFISKPINARIVKARVRTHLTLKAQSDLLRSWVYIDGLTGVHNRRHFDEALAREWNRALRRGSVLSVVLLDVDHFKRYNDHYGHPAGDECLRRIASEMTRHVKRPADLLARYGGEEFACILPDTGHEGAMQFARQLGTHIQELGIAHAASDTSEVVTVSLGVGTVLAPAAHGADRLLELADAQLYDAKRQGRNRACGALLTETPT
jgi:diguanylate cyclase (GGDEF)-like protein